MGREVVISKNAKYTVTLQEVHVKSKRNFCERCWRTICCCDEGTLVVKVRRRGKTPLSKKGLKTSYEDQGGSKSASREQAEKRKAESSWTWCGLCTKQHTEELPIQDVEYSPEEDASKQFSIIGARVRRRRPPESQAGSMARDHESADEEFRRIVAAQPPPEEKPKQKEKQQKRRSPYIYYCCFCCVSDGKSESAQKGRCKDSCLCRAITYIICCKCCRTSKDSTCKGCLRCILSSLCCCCYKSSPTKTQKQTTTEKRTSEAATADAMSLFDSGYELSSGWEATLTKKAWDAEAAPSVKKDE